MYDQEIKPYRHNKPLMPYSGMEYASNPVRSIYDSFSARDYVEAPKTRAVASLWDLKKIQL